MKRRPMNRRQFGATLTSSLAVPALAKSAPAPVVLGFIYNGPKNDLGYNQSHADGKASLAGMPGIKAVEDQYLRPRQ